jgi:hypothetical protein
MMAKASSTFHARGAEAASMINPAKRWLQPD